MTDTKFTPGPWISDSDHPNTWHPNIRSTVDSNIFAGNICTVLSNLIYPGNDPKMHIEMKANAHLIAAATELYEALEIMLADYWEASKEWDKENQEYATTVIDQSRAALAKATGSTQHARL